MKLFSKYNRISIAALVLVFIVGCMAFYFVVRYVLIRQLDDTLITEQTEIISYVKEHNRLPEIVDAYNQQIAFTEINTPLPPRRFYSLKIRNAKKKGYELTRELTFGITASNKNYLATVSKSQMETEDLLQLVIGIGGGMMALILIAGYSINRLVIRRLWKPFYKTVQEVEQYQLAKQQPLLLEASNIDEFDLLNQRLTNMTERAQQDYQVVKEFSANAAHEMQTPLAVIRSHTEAMMQDESILKQHDASIQTIEQSVDRLTRLNQALLLLAKIENRQFVIDESISLDELIRHKTEELSELIASQKITLEMKLAPVSLSFNQHLAETLVNNLLNNAIRYNVPGGKIIIQLTPSGLSISNTSSLPPLDPEKLSQRFYRHPQTQPDGNGLGLSIVKQVCEQAGYWFNYNYLNGLHVFAVGL